MRLGVVLFRTVIGVARLLRKRMLRKPRSTSHDARMDEIFPVSPPISSENEPLPPTPSAQAEEVARSIRN